MNESDGENTLPDDLVSLVRHAASLAIGYGVSYSSDIRAEYEVARDALIGRIEALQRRAEAAESSLSSARRLALEEAAKKVESGKEPASRAKPGTYAAQINRLLDGVAAAIRALADEAGK